MDDIRTIGIVGAGKLGVTLAQLAFKAGYTVYISHSGDPLKIKLIIDVLAPGAIATTNQQVAERADVIILALPLGKFRQLQSNDFADKLVIDATNHWWEVDGPRNEILPPEQSSSEAIQSFLTGSRVVKALSHMSYHDLHDEPRPAGTPNRKAIAIAGDSSKDVATVSQLIDTFGFDPLPIGNLAAGRKLEPGSAAFGADVTKHDLQKLLQ